MQVGQRLTSVTRDPDYVVRWGGEEFLVVTHGADRRKAPILAERLRRAIATRPFELSSGPRLAQTCSIGYAAFPLDPSEPRGAGWAAAVDLADRRLYAAKHAGRDRWVGDTVVAEPSAG
jgi:diguanylate cyclase (GGDEF)-like protein